MIPSQIFDQVQDKCTEGLALALASHDDGAIMEFRWCNKAFTKITGLDTSEVIGQRGSILVGPNTPQGKHLRIIEKLMNWEHFFIKVLNNRKNGDPYWQKMSWFPLSDQLTGDRWWLCSLIELEPSADEIVKKQPVFATAPNQNASTEHLEKIHRLTLENKRLHALAKSVAQVSNEDPLTGLSNRRHFEVELQSWISNLHEKGTDFAVFYIDLDRFKSVNDTLGHAAGDSLLISVADRLRALTSEDDLVARLGGDEFIILKRLGDTALNISSLADAIVQKMQAPFWFDKISTHCSASVGVAIANANMENPEQVVADADIALYHAKSQGRAKWSFFTEEMHTDAIATKQLASDLLVACEARQFIPFFQPLVDANTGRISSAEVLVRWVHPERGLLAPDAFLETAASMGILKQVDAIVFSYLRETLEFFDKSGVDLPRVTINVSAGRLADPTFIHDVKSSGISSDRLMVEILESVYLERMGDVVDWAIDELNEMGVLIAIDDFGTGHASIQGLLKIKPEVLKIDRQFVEPIVRDENSRALVSSIVGIGKSLGVRIVAEGVESEDHARFVSNMGCDYLQGHHFGKPMSASDLRDRLRDNGGQFWTSMPKKRGPEPAQGS